MACPQLSTHAVAEIFPPMDDEAFHAMKEDFKKHGQLDPIWLHDGQIVDGRNRYRVCRELDLKPKVRNWDGIGSLVEFVVAKNLYRRHLTAGQRAAIAAQIQPRLADEAKERQRKAGGDKRSANARAGKKSLVAKLPQAIPAKGKARDQAAKLAGASPRYVTDAKTLQEKAPKLFEKVRSGKLSLPQAKKKFEQEEKRKELAIKAASQPIDQESSWQIVHGNCLKVLDTVPDGTARLGFAEPPYNLRLGHVGDKNELVLPNEEYLRWTIDWMSKMSTKLTSDGSLWVLTCDEWADHVGCIMSELGLSRRDWIVWDERCSSKRANCFNRAKRHLFYVVKDPGNFVFNPEAVTVNINTDKGDQPTTKLWDNIWRIPRLAQNSEERIPDFPAQLPLALARAIVGCASHPGDLILDPFSGSASLGVAAVESGRRFIGIEKDKRYAGLSQTRLAGVAPA